MYIATFHTHFGATSFNRTIGKLGQIGTMCPVPRVLSASCGVCVKFHDTANMDFSTCQDLDSVYKEVSDGKYELIFSEE